MKLRTGVRVRRSSRLNPQLQDTPFKKLDIEFVTKRRMKPEKKNKIKSNVALSVTEICSAAKIPQTSNKNTFKKLDIEFKKSSDNKKKGNSETYMEFFVPPVNPCEKKKHKRCPKRTNSKGFKWTASSNMSAVWVDKPKVSNAASAPVATRCEDRLEIEDHSSNDRSEEESPSLLTGLTSFEMLIEKCVQADNLLKTSVVIDKANTSVTPDNSQESIELFETYASRDADIKPGSVLTPYSSVQRSQRTQKSSKTRKTARREKEPSSKSKLKNESEIISLCSLFEECSIRVETEPISDYQASSQQRTNDGYNKSSSNSTGFLFMSQLSEPTHSDEETSEIRKMTEDFSKILYISPHSGNYSNVLNIWSVLHKVSKIEMRCPHFFPVDEKWHEGIEIWN